MVWYEAGERLNRRHSRFLEQVRPELQFCALLYGMAFLEPSLFDLNSKEAWRASRYKEDIENARKLGCNSFRLSLGQSCS